MNIWTMLQRDYECGFVVWFNMEFALHAPMSASHTPSQSRLSQEYWHVLALVMTMTAVQKDVTLITFKRRFSSSGPRAVSSMDPNVIPLIATFGSELSGWVSDFLVMVEHMENGP
jgi:hypothetical protein